jgi:cytosine/adenosine deaminase-related metal-dependent hydrolase
MADKVFTARWVFPVSGPPLEHGVLLVTDDRIVAVAKHGRFTPDVDFGNAAIVPGFVNAHTHLDLTGARGLTPPTPEFTAWLRSVIAYRKTRTSEQVNADIQAGMAECLRHATTLVGDISAGETWRQLGSATFRSVVFHELIGLTRGRASRVWQDMARIHFGNWVMEIRDEGDGCSQIVSRGGLAPHAPYSVSEWLQRRVATRARDERAAVAIHLAETQAEIELLLHSGGEFVTFLQELNAWDPGGLVRSLEQVLEIFRGVFPFLIVHGNYLSADTAIPPRATIVYCPRTHAAFGHPPHPFREFLARGVRVALGTDSLASNPDLSVLAEARFIASRYPDFDRATLLRMATLSGAEALGWSDVAGSLEPGKSADFAVVALPDRDTADPHELLFHSDLPVQQTWFRGERVFERT